MVVQKSKFYCNVCGKPIGSMITKEMHVCPGKSASWNHRIGRNGRRKKILLLEIERGMKINLKKKNTVVI